MNEFKYSGQELEIFSKAQNWKSYWSSRIFRHMGESILEVGAGIGSNTILFKKRKLHRWTCLEPDTKFAQFLSANIIKKGGMPQYEVINGTLKNLPEDALFDTILYIDVLEHIYDDRNELNLAKKYLDHGGSIIILLPAHPCLFSEFDRAIGHYRRYNKLMLLELIPEHMELVKTEYLDSVGLIASMCNRYILKRQIPSRRNIWIWDSLMIPFSMVIDKFFNYTLGKSLLVILRYI